LQREPVEPLQALDLDAIAPAAEQPSTSPSTARQPAPAAPSENQALVRDSAQTHGGRDWRDSPDVMGFCGRDLLLQQSEEQIRVDRCQLFSICGEAGVGKTWFAKQLAVQLFDQYERMVWITLPKTEPAPRLDSLLADLLATLGSGENVGTAGDRPGKGSSQSAVGIAEFIDFLMDYPCLIVLDQFEVLLEAGVDDGAYQSGYGAYGELLSQLGRRSHRSCVVITSRENPNEAMTASGGYLVHQLLLPGFEQMEAEEFLAARGCGDSSPSIWRRLSQKCNGNPKALQAVASWIQEAHFGDIEDFLATPGSFPREIMAEQAAQFARLSPLEQEILSQLCQQERPILTAKALREMTVSDPGSRPNAQRSLLRRSLLLSNPGQPYAYQVSPLMQQYLCNNRPIPD